MFLVIALSAWALTFAPRARGAENQDNGQNNATAASADSPDLIEQASWAAAALEYKEAYDLTTRAISLEPKNPAAWDMRAVIDNKLGRYEQALQDENAALRLAPGDETGLLNRSWTLSQLKRYSPAFEDAESVIKAKPEDSFAYQDAALALAGLGDKDGALQALSQSARLNPEFQARYNEASQAVSADEILPLLSQDSGAQPAAAGQKAGPPFSTLLLLTLSGGLLIALGILSFFPLDRKTRKTPRSKRLPPGKPREDDSDVPEPYKIIKPIGQTPLDLSYQARDAELNRFVTIRKLRREIRADLEARRRFLDKARIIAGLSHPNIATIYQVIENGNDIFLVLEWLDGRPLSAILARHGPLSYRQCCRILESICRAVDYAHGKNLIHGDINPGGIAVSKEGAIKLTDFGLTRVMQDTLLVRADSEPVPPAGDDYSAPELSRGRPCPQSDVFSLGICFYEMLCGRKPFKGEGHFLELNKAGGLFIPIPAEATQGIPEGLDAVFKKALAPDPAARQQTAAELYADLQRLLPAGG